MPDNPPAYKAGSEGVQLAKGLYREIGAALLTTAKTIRIKAMTLSKIDEYIEIQPATVQPILQKIRQVVRDVAPEATETISYGIPTFDVNGTHLVHFAGFKNHISFFPTSSPMPVFKKELEGYKTSAGTIQFSLDKPIPYDLIKKITIFRLKEIIP